MSVASARSPSTVGLALKSLEYRGYDSWGIAWSASGRLNTIKETGKVPTGFTFDALSRIAIGHTRWATHGGVTTANAHPHLDATGRVAIVHNGIVENAEVLRARLSRPGQFASETDSEVIAHLLGQRVAAGESIVEAMQAVFPALQGQNAVIAIDQGEEVIAAAMNVSPLVVATGPEGSYISSDPFALAGKASHMIVAPNDAVLRLGPDGITVHAYDGRVLPLPDAHPVPDATVDDLDGHRHFMSREMADQPSVLQRLLDDDGASARLGMLIESAGTIVLTGCGSAYYAARIASTWLSTIAGKRSIAIPASDIEDAVPYLGPDNLVIAVTQSGETADVLDAVRLAQANGTRVSALVNVEHSSVTRLADDVVPLLAGRERSVLATKSMSAMLSRLLLGIGHSIGQPATTARSVSCAAQTMVQTHDSDMGREFVGRVASSVAGSDHVFVIGKGAGAGVAMETALKVKEASYVHAEAFTAGELKHGAIALIEPGSPCIVCGPDNNHHIELGSSSQELRSRGGYTFGIGMPTGGGVSDGLRLPDVGPANAIVQVTIAQHIAYQSALLCNLDPDYPRNLAKSVTVK